MELSKCGTSCAGFSIFVLLAALAGCASPQQETFASPEEAVKALQDAAEAQDRAAMRKLFGPEIEKLSTRDKVEDANGRKKFAALMAQGCQMVKENENQITLEVGPNNWPMPIPLVKANDVWYFDTPAGEEEIINRHIGKNELTAIGVCRAYVNAQKTYAAQVGGGTKYAQKFRSSPGKKDGLYWSAAPDEPASPLGELVAQAHAEGYGQDKKAGPHPFRGYCFRILTRQGAAAPGGELSYIKDGDMTGGFALVAYPAAWDRSGIMTFIVNQDGKIYQRNLGAKTAALAQEMKEYNPDSNWTLVEDTGVPYAPSEK